MSITDELRGYVQSWRETPNLMDDLDAGDIDGLLGDFEHIADRIDAEHQKAIRELNNFADASVLLPVDADGEYIHVGDVMDSRVDYLFDGKPFTVRALVLCEDGWEVADGRFGNHYEPDSLRHHHALTVEDLLREFTHAILNQKACYREQNIAEYAAKLRLAEGEDE